VAGISILFLLMIRIFLLAVFLAAVFAGMAHPLYRWLLERLRRPALASLATILILLLGLGLPLAGFLTIVATEAIQVSQGAEVWFRTQAGRLEEMRGLLERVPFVGPLLPDGEQLLEQFQQLLRRTGPALMGTLAAATRGTLNFLLQSFILAYALFFFLVDGPVLLRRILYYIPLSPAEEEQLLERFVSVTRATLKGSLLIGVIQGGVAGLAFWVAGGAGLVWVPAVIYLFLAGSTLAAVGLLAWCALVVSTLDNFLRPRLIGRDARMSDLLILLSTLGGILLFGAVGFIVGPIVAALFVTVWHIYGEMFREWLPRVPEERRATESAQSPAESKPASK
jgi:predicted PurR-regulated permease PerM